MSLGSHDRCVLNAISQDLAASDPELAGLIGTFTRLTAGEQMPPRECIPARRKRFPAPVRGLLTRLGPARALMLLWLLVTAVMISMAVAFSSGGAASCNTFWAKTCTAHSPAMTTHSRAP